MIRRKGMLTPIVFPDPAVAGPPAFAPTDIAGMRVWAKADTLVLSNNDPVTTLSDSSGFGYTFTAAGGEEPTYKTNIANGKPSILFNGTATRLRNANVPAQGTGAFSFYIVVKAVSVDSYRNAWTLGTSAGAKACFLSTNGDVIEFGLYGGAFLNTGTAWGTTTVRVILCRYDGTTFYAYRDGVATATPTRVAPGFNLDTNGLSIGAGTGFGQFWNGHIFEWGMYDGCITVGDVASIQTYAATKYGIA